jgi:hypothetical protein
MGATYPKSPTLPNKRNISENAESTGPKRTSLHEAVPESGTETMAIMPLLNEYMDTTNQYPERRTTSDSDLLEASEEDSESGTGISRSTILLKLGNGPSTVVLGSPIAENSNHNRRQAHIASEQKRRQSINEGFEDLRRVIPSCVNTSDSKAVILRKAVNYIRLLQNDSARHKMGPQYEQRSQSPVGYAPGPSSLRTGYGSAHGAQFGGQYVIRPMGANSPPMYPTHMVPTHSNAPMNNPSGPFVRIHHPTHQQLCDKPMLVYSGPQLPPIQHASTTLAPLQLPYPEANETPYNRDDYVSAASLSMLRQDLGAPPMSNAPPGQPDPNLPFAHNDRQ